MLFSSIINYTKKSLRPHGLGDFSVRGVFLQPLFYAVHMISRIHGRVLDLQVERLNESGKITMELSKKNIYIHSISVTSESMEDYFLRLTGGVDHV